MISDIAVRRPVFAAVAAILLCVIGLAAFTALPVRELPDIDPPIVSVNTVYTGASAEVMAAGLDVILGDEQVKSVFVNVFGGITACDEVANGIVKALEISAAFSLSDVYLGSRPGPVEPGTSGAPDAGGPSRRVWMFRVESGLKDGSRCAPATPRRAPPVRPRGPRPRPVRPPASTTPSAAARPSTG